MMQTISTLITSGTKEMIPGTGAFGFQETKLGEVEEETRSRQSPWDEILEISLL